MDSAFRCLPVWRGAAARLRARVVMCLALLALIISGCKDKGDRDGGADAAARLAPPPAGLLAELFVSTPDTTYQRVRGKVGGPAALLPATFPALVVTLLGLPPQLAEQIDANLPAVGVVIDTAPGREPDVVIGVHLRNEGKVREVLATGPQAAYDLRKDTSGVTLVERKVKDPQAFASMGLADNYLIASKTQDGLILAGAYVSRTLPTRPVPSAELTVTARNQALSGPLQTRLRNAWAEYKREGERRDEEMRKEHGGRAPDYGDPTAALADLDGKVRRLLDVLGDLDEARLETTTDDAGAHSKVIMVPRANGTVATREIQSLVVGDTAPLQEMPAGAVVAMLSRDSEELRKVGAKDQADGLANVLGDRISADHRKKVSQVLDTLAASRGDWLGAAVTWGPKEQSLLIRGEVKDTAALDKSIAQVFEIARLPGLQEPIERVAGKLAFGKQTTAGSVRNVHVKREVVSKPKEPPSKSEFDIRWDTTAPVFSVVATPDAKAWAASREKDKGPTIGTEPMLANALKPLGNEASFVFMVQPARLSTLLSPRAVEPKETAAPVVFSYGRAKADGWFRLDLPYGVLADLTRGLIRR